MGMQNLKGLFCSRLVLLQRRSELFIVTLQLSALTLSVCQLLVSCRQCVGHAPAG